VIDRRLRQVVGPPLDAAGRRRAALGLRPGWITGTGWVLGAGSCVAVGIHRWPVALVLWLANRACDGLDGPVARAIGPTERGGFIDVVADFSVYGGFVVGVAVAVPPARLACCALLLGYYCSGTALLALSSLVERRGQINGDGRSLHLTGGLAEGAETIVVYTLFCLLSRHAAPIAWVFTGAVAVTAAQRIWMGFRLLAPDGPADRMVPASRRGR
jgi:phosphatidylglycerophosphate synthase